LIEQSQINIGDQLNNSQFRSFLSLREEDVSEEQRQSSRRQQLKTKHQAVKSVVEYKTKAINIEEVDELLVTRRENKPGQNPYLMLTPAALFNGAIYRGNDENKRLYASAIRHDGQSSIKKNQLTRRTANSKPTAEAKKRMNDDSFNQSIASSIVDVADPI